MSGQATSESKWKHLSQAIIDVYQRHYSVDLSQTRYAENIRTSEKNTATTFPGEIFFPRGIDPENNVNDLHWLLHEMTHLEQYHRLGGLHGYLDQYSSDIVVKVLTRQTFDPHDLLAYEIEADTKADALTGLFNDNRGYRK